MTRIINWIINLKAETHYVTNGCDMSLQQVTATNRLMTWKSLSLRQNLSLQSVAWIQTGLNRATHRRDKISASSLVAARERLVAAIVCLGLKCSQWWVCWVQVLTGALCYVRNQSTLLSLYASFHPCSKMGGYPRDRLASHPGGEEILLVS